MTSPASPGASIEYEPSELTLVPPVKEQDMVLRRMDLQPYIRYLALFVISDINSFITVTNFFSLRMIHRKEQIFRCSAQ